MTEHNTAERGSALPFRGAREGGRMRAVPSDPLSTRRDLLASETGERWLVGYLNRNGHQTALV